MLLQYTGILETNKNNIRYLHEVFNLEGHFKIRLIENEKSIVNNIMCRAFTP